MKKRTLTAFLLMMSLLAGTACAQMNYDLQNPNLRYEKLDSGEAMPVLIDVLEEAKNPDDMPETVIGGEVAPAEMIPMQEEPDEDVWPKTFTITLAGDTTLGSTDDLRKRDDCFERVAEEKGYGWFFSGLTDLFAADDMTLVNFEVRSPRKPEKKKRSLTSRARRSIPIS